MRNDTASVVRGGAVPEAAVPDMDDIDGVDDFDDFVMATGRRMHHTALLLCAAITTSPRT